MAEREGLTRRELLKYSTLTVAGMAVTGVAGYLLGEQRERGRLLLLGDLTRELEAELGAEGYSSVYVPVGGTVETIRRAGLAISSSPWQDGEPDFEKVPSEHPWIAINPDRFPLPSEGDLGFRDMTSLVRGESTNLQRRVGREIEVILGEVIDYVGLDHAYQVATGQELIREGFIMTTTTFEGKGVGIGRPASGEPLGYSVFDAPPPQDAIPPDGFLAAGLLVPRLP